MKAIIVILGMLLMVSCSDAGVTRKTLNGDESTLPDELKGLKVYSVSTGDGNYVKVAILDNKLNSTTYKVSKHEESTIILNKEASNVVDVKEVVYENDSIIIFKK